MIRLITLIRTYSVYLLILYSIAVISVSSIPSLPTIKIHTQKAEIRLDYLIHFFEYGILAFLAFLSFSGKEMRINPGKLVLITAGLLIFAVVDELHQKLIPGRTYNILDMLSNISGILAALLLSLITFLKRTVSRTT